MKTLTNLPVIGAVWMLMTSGAMLVSTAVPARAEEAVEVLTRGPVHEAFAEAVSLNPEPGIIVRSAPPKVIEELPPEHQPEGDNVTWIPGYWAWDDDRDDYLWVSGIWRNIPPERQWVPGYWRDVRDGQYQWTSGYWADIGVEEATYISEAPPRTLEAGPNMPAPSRNHNWVPGTWAWSDAHYVWRPGYWVVSRPNWVWVPARYFWTPHGWVYVSGYWDYGVSRRGVLFAPVYYREPIYRTQDYYFTPAIVVAISVFSDHLFVRPRHHHYYFGDYYAPRYRDSGYYASFSWHSSRQGYDPIFAYQTWEHRDDRRWLETRREQYEYFQRHEDARPPHTWAAMRDIREQQLEEGRNVRFATALDTMVEQPVEGLRFRELDRERRQRFVEQNRAIRNFSQERLQMETRAREAAAAAETREVVRERIARSPVVGRRVEQLKQDEAPPARPEAAVAGVREPDGEGRTAAGTGEEPQQDPRAQAGRQRQQEEARGQAEDDQQQRRDSRVQAERQRQQEEARGQAQRDQQQQRESRVQTERQRQQEEARARAERAQQEQRDTRAQAERQRQQEEPRGQAQRDQQQQRESRLQAERQRQQEEARARAERAQQEQRDTRAQAERQRQQEETRGQAERAQQQQRESRLQTERQRQQEEARARAERAQQEQRESRAQAERQRQQQEARGQAERAQQQQRESRAQAERAQQQQQQQRQQQEARAQAERQRQQQQQEARARAQRAQQQQQQQQRQEAPRGEQRRSQRQSEEDEEERR